MANADGKALKVGNIVIIDKESVYHTWVMQNYAKDHGFSYRSIDIDPKWQNVHDLRYGSIFSKKEIILLNLPKEITNVPMKLAEINRRNRIILVGVNNHYQSKLVNKVGNIIGLDKVGALPKVIDYESKESTLQNVVKGWGIKFESGDLRKVLVSLMISDETSWNTVRDLCKLYAESKKKLTQDDLEDLYPNADFYNLNQYLLDVLKGKTKWKNYKKADYFINQREYAPAWLMGKLREVALNINLVYTAYRRGVLGMPLDKTTLQRRIDVAQIKGLNLLQNLSMLEQRNYLDYVKEIPYNVFKEIEREVYLMPREVNEAEIYGLIESIKYIRERNASSIKVKPFVRK